MGDSRQRQPRELDEIDTPVLSPHGVFHALLVNEGWTRDQRVRFRPEHIQDIPPGSVLTGPHGPFVVLTFLPMEDGEDPQLPRAEGRVHWATYRAAFGIPFKVREWRTLGKGWCYDTMERMIGNPMPPQEDMRVYEMTDKQFIEKAISGQASSVPKRMTPTEYGVKLDMRYLRERFASSRRKELMKSLKSGQHWGVGIMVVGLVMVVVLVMGR